jgi:flagellar biosynthesis anti-sigma factor FlgM
MRIIDSNSVGHSGAPATGRAGEAQSIHSTTRKGSPARSASGDFDTVELSGSMKGVEATLQGEAASRAEKVQRLAAAVQGGTYQVDVQAVSSALVDEALSGGER